MPTVTCPGCQKQYKLPDTAAGQVASCKCGKRFRVGGASPTATTPSQAPAKAAAAPKPQAAVAAAKPVVAKAAGVAAAVASKDDDFWDKALSEPVAQEPPPAPKPAPRIGAATAPTDRRRSAEREFDEPQKKVRWGADWGKVGVGLATFVLAGGLDLFLVMSAGRLNIWLAVVAVGGLITCINGLMGEEGIW